MRAYVAYLDAYPTRLPTYPITNNIICKPSIHIPTHIPIYLPTCLPSYIPTYLRAYLPTSHKTGHILVKP